MRTSQKLRGLAVALILMPALFAGGCARQPPSQSSLSGARLRVTMRFRAAVNRNNYYYFLINNAGNQNAPGPVPLLSPISGQSYGNGFATASDNGTGGFTDYMLFGVDQPPTQNGYGLYHAVGDVNNRTNLRFTGVPVSATLPPADPTDLAARELNFEIDLSQIIRDPVTAAAVDAVTAANQARAIRFLQINIVSTNIVPTDPQTPAAKLVDSMGDNLQTPRGSFFTLDVSRSDSLSSTDIRVLEAREPTNPDIIGGNDPSLDLIFWRVDVVRTQ